MSFPHPNSGKLFAVTPNGHLFVVALRLQGKQLPVVVASDRLAPRSKMGTMGLFEWRVSSIIPISIYAKNLEQLLREEIAEAKAEEALDNLQTTLDIFGFAALVLFPPAGEALLLANTAISGWRALNKGELEDWMTETLAAELIGRGIKNLAHFDAPNKMLRIGTSRQTYETRFFNATVDKTSEAVVEIATTPVDPVMSQLTGIRREIYHIHKLRMRFDPIYAKTFIAEWRRCQEQLKSAKIASMTKAATTYQVQPNAPPPNKFNDFKFKPQSPFTKPLAKPKPFLN